MTLIWVDLETSGLSCRDDRVLEIAVIVTDDVLAELARMERVLDEAKYVDFSKVDPYVLKMHAGNNLWNESLNAPSLPRTVRDENDLLLNYPGHNLRDTDVAVAKFIVDNVPVFASARHGTSTWDPKIELKPSGYPQLAGSTVSFDRNFLEHHMPLTFRLLHYRSLDVTALNELAKRFWPKVYEGRPRTAPESKHRAMADIVDSLGVARYYAKHLWPRNVTAACGDLGMCTP